MSSREGQMTLSKCLLCLGNSTKISPECLEFSKQLFRTIWGGNRTQVNRLESDSGISFLCCSRCRVYRMKFGKLNDRLKSLFGGLLQLNGKKIGIVRRLRSLPAKVWKTDNKGQADIQCNKNAACFSNFKFKDQLDMVENRTIAKVLTRQKLVGSVQQVSENGSIFKGKHPFEQKEFSFKCGSCPAMIKFSKRKSLCYSMMAHIKTWHLGSGRIRKMKIPQPFVEIAPHRFQYGKNLVEKYGDKYECLTCHQLASFGPRKDKSKYFSVHIRRKHESKFRNTNHL